jgi:hypothetical protein
MYAVLLVHFTKQLNAMVNHDLRLMEFRMMAAKKPKL